MKFVFLKDGDVGVNYGLDGTITVSAGDVYDADTPYKSKIANIWLDNGVVAVMVGDLEISDKLPEKEGFDEDKEIVETVAEPEPEELDIDALKAEAENLGIKVHHKAKAETIAEKIAEFKSEQA